LGVVAVSRFGDAGGAGTYLSGPSPGSEPGQLLHLLVYVVVGGWSPSNPGARCCWRSGRNAVRTSVANSSGSSQAAKWPPLSASRMPRCSVRPKGRPRHSFICRSGGTNERARRRSGGPAASGGQVAAVSCRHGARSTALRPGASPCFPAGCYPAACGSVGEPAASVAALGRGDADRVGSGGCGRGALPHPGAIESSPRR
jgi:hypothetical protein